MTCYFPRPATSVARMASPCSPQPEISVAKLYQNFLDQVKPLKHPQRKLKAAFLEHEVSPEDWPHVQKVLHHARNEDKIRFRISYSAEHKICIVYLIPTPAHEAATHNLTAILSVLIATQSGGSVWRDVVFGGSQTTDISNSGGKNIKEPDQSIYPQRPPGPDSCWPNIVIETGVSESHQRLKNDMHRWFAAAERGRVVKLVILIIIDVKEDEEASILIELYENDPNFVLRPPRAGAAQRVCDARLRSSLSLTGDLTGKELRIPWTDFFDTVPAPLAMNGNDALIMGAQDLQTWEERIITAIQAGPRA